MNGLRFFRNKLNETGGNVQSSRTRLGKNRVAIALRLTASGQWRHG